MLMPGKPEGACSAHGKMGCGMCHGGEYAKGGEVDEDHDMVGRIMSKMMSKGGMVANDTESDIEDAPASFDDLVLDDDLESSYTGADSGDEIGNATEDEGRHDIVSRILKSFAKKDRMPRQA